MAVRVDEAAPLQGPTRRSRRIPDDEYEMYRSEILAMYLKEGKSREEIRRILAVEHEFKISLKQLKHRLYKWRARKNCKHSKVADNNFETGRQQRVSAPRRPRCSVSKTGSNLLASEVSSLPNLSSGSSTEHGYTACRRVNSVRAQKQNDNRRPSICDCGDPLMPLQNSKQPTSPTLHPCVGETATGVQNLEFEDRVSRTFFSDKYSILSSRIVVARPHRVFGDLSKSVIPDESQLDLPQSFNDPLLDYPQPAIASVGQAYGDLGHGQSHSTALAASISTYTARTDPGPNYNRSSQDLFMDVTNFTNLEGPPPAAAGEEDPTVVTEALLALRSIYTRFLDRGCFWQTSLGYTVQDQNYLEVLGAFTNPGVRVALETILRRYLFRSSRWLTPTNPPRSSISSEVWYPGPDSRSPGVISSSRRFQSVPSSGQSVLLNEGHLVVLSLVGREDPDADMIKLQLRRWSERPQSTLTADSSLSMTMSFIPRAFGRKAGISLTLSASSLEQPQPRLQPTLRTFGVVPSNSDIIQCIHRNDINGVRESFAFGRAHPSDVDSEGCSLISHAVQHRRFEIFRLLLDAGAYCDDVANGLDIVSVIWGYYILRDADEDLFEETEECVEMTRLSQESCGDREEFQDNVVAGISVLNKCKRAEPLTAAPVIQYFVNLFEVESSGPSGRTQLLCACTINNTMTLEVLISRGANVRATDRFGRGALHSALYTRSYIVCPESCGTSKQEGHHQCSCPAEPNLHDCHYIHAWRECARNNRSGLEDTLRILLQNGCDPNLFDGYNCSPSDYVRQLQDLQTIWVESLADAGYHWDRNLLKWQRPGSVDQFDWELSATSWSSRYAELAAL